MSHKLGEKSKPLDFINTRCQLGAESLYIKTWALLQREDFPTELNMLLFFFFFFFTILQEKIDFLLGAPAVYYMSDLSSFAHNGIYQGHLIRPEDNMYFLLRLTGGGDFF